MKRGTSLRPTWNAALALLLVFLPLGAPRARQAPAAQQGGGRGLGVVDIKGADGREVRLYDQSHALVIGVSDYTGGWPRLPGVKRDVEAVARALERHGFQVTKVENPDSAQLDKAFKTFIEQYGQSVENRLLFYFAGHGHTVKQSYGEEMGYIVPADAPHPNRGAAAFTSKAMDMQQMELYARRIQSKHALFLFDSCFSGSIFALSRAVPDSIGYKTARPVRQFITSGSADEEVPDKSVFREQFVEALEGEADTNPKDGYVTGSELGEFLQDRVVNYSRNAQHPQYGKLRNPNLDKGDFVFMLPRAARAAATPQSAAPAAAAVDPAALDLAFWNSIQNSTNPEDYRAYLEKFPNGVYAALARRRAQVNDAKPAAPPSSAAQRPETETLPRGITDKNIAIIYANANAGAIAQQLKDSLVAYGFQRVKVGVPSGSISSGDSRTLVYGDGDEPYAQWLRRTLPPVRDFEVRPSRRGGPSYSVFIYLW